MYFYCASDNVVREACDFSFAIAVNFSKTLIYYLNHLGAKLH